MTERDIKAMEKRERREFIEIILSATFLIAVFIGALYVYFCVPTKYEVYETIGAMSSIDEGSPNRLVCTTSESGGIDYYLDDGREESRPTPITKLPPKAKYVGTSDALRYFLFLTEDSRLIAVNTSGESHVLAGNVVALLDANAEYGGAHTIEIIRSENCEVQIYNSYMNTWIPIRELK